MLRTLIQKTADFFKKSHSHLKTHKKVVLTLFLIGIIAIAPVGFHTAHANICDWSVVSSVCGAFGTVVADLLMIPMILTGWLLWLSGVLLNYILDFTVVHMAVNLDKTTGINVVWSVIRDLANITFIFVLLYAAIKTILGEGGDMKKTITGVVMAAVLLNFSLLFTKLIVDASNILTITFYSQIVKPNQGDPSQSTYSGLSDTIMQPLGLTTLYNPLLGNDLFEQLQHSLSKVAIVSIGSSIFMFAVAGVFLAISGMFIVRYISIMLLLMLSPVWILGTWLPQLKKYSGQWVSRLSSEVTFAPVFMIMMWATIVVINTSSFACLGAKNSLADIFTTAATSLSNGSSAAVAGTCTTGPFGLIMNFTIALVLVGAALTIAKSTAGHAGTTAQSITNAFAGGAAGAIGYAGRRTIGKMGNKLADNKYLSAKAVNGNWASRNLSRATLSTAKAAQKSKFDTSPVFKQMGIKAENPIAGFKVGNFGKQKTSAEIAADKKKVNDEYKANLAKITAKDRSGQNKDAVQAGIDASKDIAVLEAARLALSAGTATDEQKVMVNAADNMQKIIGKMSDKEIESLVEGNKKFLDSTAFTQTISARQLGTLHKSEKLDEQEKAKLLENRFSSISKAIKNSAVTAETKAEIRDLTDTELKLIDKELLKNESFVKELKAAQIENMLKGDELNETERKSLLDTRFKEINEAVKGGATGITGKRSQIQALSDKELAMLDRSYFENPDFVTALKGSQIDDIQKLGDFTKDQKNTIKTTRQAGHNAIIDTNKAIVNDLDVKDIAKIDITKLSDPEVLKNLSVKKLKRLRDELKDPEARAIRDSIATEAARAGGAPVDPRITELNTWLTSDRGTEEF